ncbi:MAG: glycoside hydrolase family protein [Caulobacter sp.]|nr:glycoside hydrolase family protein [Caulobacter sp.]
MNPRHQVSKAAVELIKKFEGYRSKAAQMADGRWTIGFGHTLTAREGAQVSEQDAEALLLYDLIAIAHAVNEQTYTPLTQNQFDALCCFAFNIGIDNFKRSSVLRRVNEGSLLQAACAMEMWRKADFEGERIVVDALVRRRSAEKTLFLTPAGGWVPAPSPIVRPKVDYDAVNFVPRQTPTTLNAPMTGDKAVVERDQPAAAPAPMGATATMTAAAAVTSRLAEIAPDTAPDTAPAAAPEPPVQAAPEPETVPAATEAETPAEAPAPTSAADDVADADATAEDPILEISSTPAEPTAQPAADALAFPPPPAPVETLPREPERYTPYPSSAGLAVRNGDRAFVLTPAPEEEPQVEETPAAEAPDAFRFEPANESSPGLFDISSQPIEEATPVRSQPLVSEDHVRRLVEADERELAANFDPEIDYAPLEQARIVGLPWLGVAAAGVVLCGGGVAWGYLDHTGNSVTTAVAWGLGITGAGVFFLGAWRWLESLGMPRLDDEDEDDKGENGIQPAE